MSQTRTFLIFAWLMVAALLWMAWGQDRAALEQAAQAPTPKAATANQASIPQAPAPGAVPGAPAANAAASATPQADASATPNQQTVVATTDALRLILDGGRVRSADLLRYHQSPEPGSPPVRMFDHDAARYFAAESGWVSGANAAPSHEQGFVPEQPGANYTLAPGVDRLDVPFIWRGPNGVSIRRVYTLKRNDFAIAVRDEVINAGSTPWQGHVYRQLVRIPPVVKSGFTHPESYSFHGAAWYSPQDKLEKRKFNEDFLEDDALDKTVTGGWMAMLQHHFFSAWIPAAKDAATFSLATTPGPGGMQYLIREVGPGVNVAPGTKAATEARLWVGPKLVSGIKAQGVPGLERAVDFSSYGWLAWIAELLFSVLSWLHGVFGNWGWAIVGLVVIVKALLFPLSAAQYKSAAKMRKFQPRVQQLKERYGDDKQKFQLALMELYKKEKINPVSGCLPVFLQMPIFLALYWTLLEAVELRHAPWIGWIQNLTAPDPYFILPVINIAVMWLTQKLTPMVGMDPMQQRMMQMMPLIFGVMMIFFPAGLVLYWVTNGSLGLLQQWYMLRKYGDKPTAKPAEAKAK